jgi:hypothetical protein
MAMDKPNKFETARGMSRRRFGAVGRERPER